MKKRNKALKEAMDQMEAKKRKSLKQTSAPHVTAEMFSPEEKTSGTTLKRRCDCSNSGGKQRLS
ncbi:MAG: hypothetical protein QXL10_02115 [Candidatus Bathyarchaeia archaeon]